MQRKSCSTLAAHRLQVLDRSTSGSCA
jgi:hypothetical protein